MSSLCPLVRRAHFFCWSLCALALLTHGAWGQPQRPALPAFVRPAPTPSVDSTVGGTSKTGATAGDSSGLPALPSAAPAVDLYTTDFESFPVGGNQLGGRDGWVVSNVASAVTGILDFSPNSPRAAYIGFATTTATSVFTWRPVNYSPVASGTPVIKFSVDLLISDSTNGQRDDFFFMIYNTTGQVLGGIDFYNVNQGVFRFDGAAFQSLGTFQRNARYTLVATIDFAANRWSVTLNGGAVFTNQPLTVTSNALTLGDIDAAWFITTAGSPGNNFMVFDNYRISTVSNDVAPAFTAQPRNRTVVAGQNAIFDVQYTGFPTPTFQWQRQAAGTAGFVNLTDSGPYENVTTSDMRVRFVTSEMDGDQFRCIASNVAGTVTSSAGVLKLFAAPAITSANHATFTAGATGSFTITATGYPAPTLSISVGNLPSWLSLNSTTGILSGTPPTGVETVQTFTIQAGNGFGSPATQAFELTVVVPPSIPSIVAEPLGATALVGGATLFSVTATGSPAPAFQWQRQPAGTTGFADLPDGGAYSGAATRVLNVSGVTFAMRGDQFRCTVSNSLGSVTSTAGQLSLAGTVSTARVAASANHSMILRSDGTVWGMGHNVSGQVGNGTAGGNVLAPVQIATNGRWIAAGAYHSFFGKSDGTLWGVGANNYGQLGGSRSSGYVSPVQLLSDVTEAAGGDSHSVFVKSNGTLWTMGDNDYGQLGVGNNSQQTGPIQIATGAVRVGAGSSFTLFVKSDGTLWGMGVDDWGQLGDGLAETIRRTVPVQALTTNVSSVAAGYGHTLFVKVDRTLWGMGNNQHGQLGDGSITSRATPLQIASDVVAYAAGEQHSLFVKSDGTLWATGYNASGQLGDGSSVDRTVPVHVATGVVSAAGGYEHSLFVKLDGSVWSMGRNSTGQLGDRTTAQRDRPVQIVEGTQPSLPTISQQPTDVTVNVGNSASFTVSANGSPAPTYRWQRQPGGTTGFADLTDTGSYSGTTSVTLTLTTTTIAMLGDQFRCVVSNGVGSPIPTATVTLNLLGAPSFTSAAAAKFIVGRSGRFAVAVTSAPASTFRVSAGSLPAWATLNATTGAITGTPPDAVGSPFTFTLTAANGLPPDATQTISLLVQVGHSADVSPADGAIGLAELIRVLALYGTRNATVRTGRYSAAATPTATEDGFEPDPATSGTAPVALARYHSADTNQDGRFSLTELTRVIELYNTRAGTTRTGAYHVQSTTEDGFAPGP